MLWQFAIGNVWFHWNQLLKKFTTNLQRENLETENQLLFVWLKHGNSINQNGNKILRKYSAKMPIAEKAGEINSISKAHEHFTFVFFHFWLHEFRSERERGAFFMIFAIGTYKCLLTATEKKSNDNHFCVDQRYLCKF